MLFIIGPIAKIQKNPESFYWDQQVYQWWILVVQQFILVWELNQEQSYFVQVKNLKQLLKNQLSEVKLLMINDISMVSSNMWTDTDARFSEVFSVSTDLSFTGLTISDYHQLPPVKGRFIFSRFTREVRRISCCQKWHLFKYVELTEVSVLNNICHAIVDRNTETFLKVRFINQSGDNCPIDVLHMYPD